MGFHHQKVSLSSYRTYEEWKPVDDWVSQDDVDGSYRTYEEWKPGTIAMNPSLAPVLTVPMRNGNERSWMMIVGHHVFLPYL